MALRRTVLSVGVCVATLMAVIHPARAHHSRAMFDMSRNVTYRGVVSEFRWENPHSHILVSVGASAGATGSAMVNVEASSISLMASQGWNRMTFKAGDPITVVVHPGKNGPGTALLFYAIKADGARLYRARHRYPGEKDTDG